MKTMIKNLTKKIIKKLFNGISDLSNKNTQRVSELHETVQFLNYEVKKMNDFRRLFLLNNSKNMNFSANDLKAFDFQWKNHNTGNDLLDDKNFKATNQDIICKYLKIDKDFLKGKKVLDVGAGSGRFTYGFLSMGAKVTSIEGTRAGCEQINATCQEFSENLTVLNKNILSDSLPREFDVVFCYGVVHHTGNTYLAMKNVCNTAKHNAKVFFMIYGYPDKYEAFKELNFYEVWRDRLRNKEFSEKLEEIKKNFPKENVHGCLDAFSPRENDLLSYNEIVDVLNQFGLEKIQRTLDHRNIHIVGIKK